MRLENCPQQKVNYICYYARLIRIFAHMKRIMLPAAIALAPYLCCNAVATDSVQVYLYTDSITAGHDGLHWAWQDDGGTWHNDVVWQKLVSSDYGAWGSQKRMIKPYVERGADGTWHAVWSVNSRDSVVAYASSPDLIHWKPQQYIATAGTCADPALYCDTATGAWHITWTDASGRAMQLATTDFRHYSRPEPCDGTQPRGQRQCVPQVLRTSTGCTRRIPRAELDALLANAAREQREYALSCENEASDAERFAGLPTVNASLSIDRGAAYDISPMLMGIFFEDISHAADGGLYAELIQNRDFEYSPDEKPETPGWGPSYAWTTTGTLTMTIDTVAPIHPNNPHYATIRGSGTLRNPGFDGIAVRAGERYELSMFARARGKKAVRLHVELIAQNGTRLAEATLRARPGDWQKLHAVLSPKVNCLDGWLLIEPMGDGAADLDMVSLFPVATFRDRPNGLRRDLAEYIAALRPRFVRFPGGCVAHGDGLGNIYRWKNTIGPLEARVPQRNIWGYHQTAGLGFHEYFQFCEDLGAEPVPVVAAGVPCQNSSRGGAGQQGGIPMEQMPQYVQDVLDLVEYANGDATSTEWGRRRAANGHPQPFHLKYIGVGNEDLISVVFEERFKMIHDALRSKYPDITVIGTAGPFHSGSDYDEGWRFARQEGVAMVDEHYYEQPGWFINNRHFYDGYDRRGPRVYLGEYASKSNGLYNALAEAAYLCDVERNGDVVAMTSYAPLLARIGATNWNPDLIYFSGWDVYPTPNYAVQRLFGENSGTRYIPAGLSVGSDDEGVKARIAASVVEADNGDIIIKLVTILPAGVHISGLPHGVVRFSRLEPTLGIDEQQFSIGAGGETMLPPRSLTILRYLK